MRHLLGVHVLLDCGVTGRAQGVEDQQNFIALDQLAGLLDRLRRAVRIIIGDEVDLAAVDAAFGVNLVEVGGFGLSNRCLCGCGTRVRHDVADLDFGVRCARVVFLLSISA